VIEPETNELARRQIMAATQGALRAAGVLGIIPTPLEAISQIAGLGGVVDISDLPPDLEAKKPPAWRRILGALLVRERTVFVDAAHSWPRRRFVEAHEYGHWLIPWQQASYHLDDERRLSPETKERYEVEANLAAAHLIFQGTEFIKRALDAKVGIQTPLALSADFAASCHAAIRYYVEHHPDAVALLVTGQIVGMDGAVPVFHRLESKAFRQRIGAIRDHFPAARLHVRGGDGLPFGDVLEASRLETAPRKEMILIDVRGDRRPFVVESFFNGRNHFLLLAERRSTRFGNRYRVEVGTRAEAS
jgi:hypothetical protein